MLAEQTVHFTTLELSQSPTIARCNNRLKTYFAEYSQHNRSF